MVCNTQITIGWVGTLGYQYATFWVSDTGNTSIRHLSVGRRSLRNPSSPVPRSSPWETFTFADYNQTEDDGHDTCVSACDSILYLLKHTHRPSIGISPGDGTVHLSFDHHDNQLKYRVSRSSAALNPATTAWSAELFGEIRRVRF